MKICSDCSHHVRRVVSKGQGRGDRLDLCMLKSNPVSVNPISGKLVYNYDSIATCQDERTDSNGFFGLFRDKTRCGVQAINYTEDEDAMEDCDG
jgi:hypothetical protein